MGNCKCWELQPKATYVGEYHGCKIYRNKQICNGTREREECSCDGDESKCNFYPDKRKGSKSINTAEMWIKAQEDGKTYYCCDVKYQKDIGLVEIATEKPWPLNAWTNLNNLMNEKWGVYQTMTKSEAETKFNIKIVGD